MQTYWGVDLGGTKIEGVVLSAETGTTPSPDAVLIRKRIDTEAHKGYDHILGQIVKLIDLLKTETSLTPERIGFGTPGTNNPATQTMKNCNTTVLNGKPMKQDLARLLGVPVEVANDANCFALAEATLGIVPGEVPNYQTVFGVIMGTGVGGGVVVRNRDKADSQAFVLNGLQGIGGEWGHNILEEDGYPCYCGKRGCVEQVISGPALQRYYQQISGEERTMKDIMKRYEEGRDPYASQTVDRMLEYFGKAISVIINILDPDAIVLGGGVGNVDLLYTEGVERVKKYVFNSGEVKTRFLKPKLGDSAGVFGAAML
ncbi:ROK family protein [Spirosoma utsteinense]|uniref:NBD/HSP70 family sugar kinase n=1 Tax=Spirosoma utsteinense TaxID=2585773 RepID=A0ABR6VZ35_9BACT|nr:ROK family protein [Spirosoma utsteinense]MBC3784700.1 putative NBD/HSP70 family sugar kinase [Spirosoma utsteinense]MBC3789546.1 putative NBD/HSP70 family sugar kinase [Spirosoma utsteinense]